MTPPGDLESVAVRILYLTQYLARSDEPGANRQWDLLQELARRGHHVDVVISGQHYLDLNRADAEKTRVETWEGGRLYRLAGVSGHRRSRFRRLLSYFVFAGRAAALTLRLGRYEVVLASTPSPFVGLVGWLAASVRRARLWIEVRDLWPEAAYETDLVRSRILLKACRALNAFAYRRATRLVALTPGIRRHLVETYGLKAETVEFIPNGWARDVFEQPGPQADLEGFGIRPGAFHVVYAGAFGIGNNDIPTILEAARLLRGHEDIRFVFVGDGERRREIESGRRDGSHIVIVPVQPKNAIPHFIAAADVCVLTLPNRKFFEIFLQNKIFDYMGGERCVLAAVAGDQAELLRQSGGGLVVQPGDATALAQAILELRAAPAARIEMGRRGRLFVEEHYDRRKLVAEYAEALEEAPS
jgi:colanic acid biosynthesis glycosyl transferase WcaI